MEKKELKENKLDHNRIARAISSVMRPKPPSQEFMDRVSQAVQARFQERRRDKWLTSTSPK